MVGGLVKRSALYCGVFIFLLFFAMGCNRQDGNRNLENVNNIEDYPGFTISSNRMEYDSDTSWSISGNALSSDGYGGIRERIRDCLETGEVLSCGSSKLNFHFSDEIPKSIAWSEYYLTEKGSFIYASKQDLASEGGAVVTVLDELNESICIDFGTNKVYLLASSDNIIDTTYRCIRMVLDYGNEKIEYILLFDSKLPIYPNE